MKVLIAVTDWPVPVLGTWTPQQASQPGDTWGNYLIETLINQTSKFSLIKQHMFVFTSLRIYMLLFIYLVLYISKIQYYIYIYSFIHTYIKYLCYIILCLPLISWLHPTNQFSPRNGPRALQISLSRDSEWVCPLKMRESSSYSCLVWNGGMTQNYFHNHPIPYSTSKSWFIPNWWPYWWKRMGKCIL
jgi:hypothetical protein